LLSQSVRAHFAVGYFFLSGFKAIADQLATVQELRLLIGNTSDRATIEQMAEGHISRDAIIAHQREDEFLKPSSVFDRLESPIKTRDDLLRLFINTELDGDRLDCGLTAAEIKLVEESGQTEL
jgi:hypothetical protein